MSDCTAAHSAQTLASHIAAYRRVAQLLQWLGKELEDPELHMYLVSRMSKPAMKPTQPSIQWVTNGGGVVFDEGKSAGTWRWRLKSI